jgi:phospholipase/carboxylesterase
MGMAVFSESADGLNSLSFDSGVAMLDYFELDAAGAPAALMVWLHGLGADGYDLEPAAEMLAVDDIRHVFPHAPARPVTVNRGMRMRAWFDVAAADVRWQEDSEGILASARQVRELVAVLRGESALPVVLAGFSQGAVVSLAAAAQGMPGLIGVAAMSGYVPQFLLPPLADLRGMRLFMAHGEQDEVIPFALGKASRDALRERGLEIDWHAYAMPHAICQQELHDMSAWLSALLGRAREGLSPAA